MKRFNNDKKFTREELINAFVRYKSRKSILGGKNHNYKNGMGEQYVRIRIKGKKVKRSHIVWMLYHNKDCIPKDYDIHHKDGNKRNDCIENLELMDSLIHACLNLNVKEKKK